VAGAPPPSIPNNAYTVEYTQGPVFASNRAVGMGGAATAIAEDVEGLYYSPASPAVYEAKRLSWFDWTPDVGISFAGAYTETDYENRGKLGVSNGEKTYNNFYRVDFGAVFAFGNFGFGATFDVINTHVREPSKTGQGLDLSIFTAHAPVSYAFWDQQLVVGVGVRTVTMNLDSTVLDKSNNITDKLELFSTTATGIEAGFVVKPNEAQWRGALTFRGASSASVNAPGGDTTKGVTRVSNLITPTIFRIPAEMEMGFAYQFGPRLLNPTFVDVKEAKKEVGRTLGRREVARVAEKNNALDRVPPEDREAYGKEWDARNQEARAADQAWAEDEKARLDSLSEYRRLAPRQKLLVLASVVALGTSSNAVGISGFLDQAVQPVGRSITLSPHVGTEFEPWRNRLITRLGSYLEPSRYAGVGPRVHGTTGFTVRLFEWTVFGLWPDHTSWTFSASADLANRGYFDWGIGLGTWD
jgi:hypothetical protein